MPLLLSIYILFIFSIFSIFRFLLLFFIFKNFFKRKNNRFIVAYLCKLLIINNIKSTIYIIMLNNNELF